MVDTFTSAVCSVTKQGMKLLLLLSDCSLETTREGWAPEENAELLRLAVGCSWWSAAEWKTECQMVFL